MADIDQQLEYWDTTGAVKTFTHPVAAEWLTGLDDDARVLDYGCGYGRLAGRLQELGFRRIEGVDLSPALVARAGATYPGARFSVLTDPPRLDLPGGGTDLALLFAVLTCIPTDEGQRGVVDELRRVLRPGGLLYLSDYCLQPDERNQARYDRFSAEYGSYGVFETGDGAVCRHHAPEWLRELLAGFEVVRTREIDVATMNGHPARITQWLLSRTDV
ncbi:class I SAM-dependent methyltransferase [Kitasatospora acidiphila]|uniref:class I SAM-dependent methyltransferase n=1 Tax=Kitasatospora acidiphila TaxID=2567942 RepID=UPI003C750E3A